MKTIKIILNGIVIFIVVVVLLALVEQMQIRRDGCRLFSNCVQVVE